MKIILPILSLITIIFLSNCGWYEDIEESVFGSDSTDEDSEISEASAELIEKINEKIKEKIEEDVKEKIDQIVESQGNYKDCMSKELYLDTRECLDDHKGRIEEIISVTVTID